MGRGVEHGGRTRIVITLDASAAAALLLRDSPRHRAAVRELSTAREPVVVPLAILSDIDRALSSVSRAGATVALLEGIQRGETLLDCGDLDLPRIRELMSEFLERPLDLAGAAVVACAERAGGAILSFDRDALSVVVRDVPVTLIP